MISMSQSPRINPHKAAPRTAFGRDFHFQELSGLYDRQPMALFDVSVKVGAREIKKYDGAQAQLDLVPSDSLYKNSADAVFFKKNAGAAMDSDSYIQVANEILEWPKVEKKSWALDLNLLNQFAQGKPKAIAKAGFALGAGAFDPRQAISVFESFHAQPLMIFNGTPKALTEFERRARDMFKAEHPARAFLAGVFHR